MENYFENLSKVPIKKDVNLINFEIQGGRSKGKILKFNYLSWAHAWSYLKKKYPNATFHVHEREGLPYIKSEVGFFVKVSVRVDDVEHTQLHPVLDQSNRPIASPNAFQINTSIQRCFAKCIALHGLGLSLYTGEDIPDETDPSKKQPKPVAKQPKKEVVSDHDLIKQAKQTIDKGIIDNWTKNKPEDLKKRAIAFAKKASSSMKFQEKSYMELESHIDSVIKDCQK